MGDGGGLSACLGADKKVVFATTGDGAHPTLGGVVVLLEDAVGAIAREALHPRQTIAAHSGERLRAGDAGQLHGQPSLKVVEDRGGIGLAEPPRLHRRGDFFNDQATLSSLFGFG